jgi:hypothetical protein
VRIDTGALGPEQAADRIVETLLARQSTGGAP